VVAVDPGRSWFRYHHLFADLLQLELRRAEPDQVTGLHRAAAGWFAEHGSPVEAVRHAQAARDWPLAARLLADRWPRLYLDGQAATVHGLLARFPAEARAADAELAAVAAGDELAQGSLEAAERYLALAERAPVPEGRAGQAQLLLGMVRLLLARQRGDPPTVAEQARRLEAAAEAPEAAPSGLGEELRALALISLGSTEFWVPRFEEARRHLDQGVALARRIGRPYLEFTGLAYAANPIFRSFALAVERGRQAVELAERHGWADESAAGMASLTVAGVLTWQGRLEEAEPWIQRAERTFRADAEPAVGLNIRTMRGVLELARCRDADALAAFQAGERMAARLTEANLIVHGNRQFLVQALVRLGETERAEEALALGDQDRDLGHMRIGLAVLRLAQDDPSAAVAALAPVLGGSAPAPRALWLTQAFLLEAIARDALGDPPAAASALERALDLAETDGVLTMFLLHPAPGLLQRQARQRTAHAALVADILSLLAGNRSAPPPPGPRPPLEPLSDSELRVLRFLPTNLSAPEIAGELYVSVNTVQTHMRHLYAKLGTHRRAETVARARALGLLAPSPHRGQATRPG
jgi:LuxR family maltose regulon positive regulatory protein